MVSANSSTDESSNHESERTPNMTAPSRQSPSVSRTSSSAYESSSQSIEKVSTPPSNAHHENFLRSTDNANISTEKMSTPANSQNKKSLLNVDISTPSKPSSQGEKKGKKTVEIKGEKSRTKSGPIWNANDEIAFMKVLATSCEKGKGPPKFTSDFCDKIRSQLNGYYSNGQLSNKNRGLRNKFKNKVKAKVFSFQNANEEIIYELSSNVWGNGEEEEECSEKVGKKIDKKAVEMRSVGVKRKKRNDGGEEREGLEGKKHLTLSDGEGKRVADASDDQELVDLLRKENMKMMDSFTRQMLKENQDFMDELKREMMELVREELQGY